MKIAEPKYLDQKEGDEYLKRAIADFKREQPCGAGGALTQFSEACMANCWLEPALFGRFCSEVGLDARSVKPMCEVGGRLLDIDNIEYSRIFALLFTATLQGKEFDTFVRWAESAVNMDADELREHIVGELVKGRRPFR
jgi:hypothetical protein